MSLECSHRVGRSKRYSCTRSPGQRCSSCRDSVSSPGGVTVMPQRRKAGSVVLRIIKKHLAFAMADGVANALAEAEEKGCALIDKAPRKGAEGLNIAFLHPKSTCGALLELCEDPNK